MAYNMRRGGYSAPSSAVGQRRTNFMSDGQRQIRPSLGARYVDLQVNRIESQPMIPPRVRGHPFPRHQQQKPLQNPQQLQQQLQQQHLQQQQLQQQQQQLKPEPKILFKNDQQEQRTAEISENIPAAENGEGEGAQKIKKPFFKTGKINKKDRLRRRNQRLRKILQPKNAPMVLNELVGSCNYNVSEVSSMNETAFKASVIVDGVEHVGYGKSKSLAKSNSAEAAIKHLILKKITNINSTPSNPQQSTDEEDGVKMDVVTEEDDNFSWSHIASFALHKLFNSWEEDGVSDKIPGISSSVGLTRIVTNPQNSEQKPEHKPAKKIPPNPELMNPIMLLNQMRPSAVYEEVSQIGSPPHIQFTYRCNVDGLTFEGTGSSKKNARKHAAYAACKAVLNINYPKEILDVINVVV